VGILGLQKTMYLNSFFKLLSSGLLLFGTTLIIEEKETSMEILIFHIHNLQQINN
jgi:hypothetical protein